MLINALPDAEGLRHQTRGRLFMPDDDGYEVARRVWNGSVDQWPAAVLRCLDERDVVAGIRHAREHDLLLAVRGGGHDVAGFGTCQDGLVLDLSLMKRIDIDARLNTATVAPGVLWGELDAATAAANVAITGGQISSTGVAGLTLGGGIGWLMRDFGLTIDSLLAAEIVTADGARLKVSQDEHPDLFWAIRGGGGNFGVVTRFEFRTRPLRPEIIGGTVAHPASRAYEMLEFFRTYAPSLPDTLSPMAYFFTMPSLPMIPPALRGRALASIAVCYSGPESQGARLLGPVRQFGPPLADTIQPMPYTRLQTLFDDGSRPGFFNYWKSCYLQPLTQEATATIASFVERITSPLSIVLVTAMGGAVARVPAEMTAFGHRDAAYVLEILAKWGSSSDAAAHVEWADAFWRATRRFSTGGVYVNFLGREGPQRIRQAYTPAVFERLRQIKRTYDPENVFHHNQNIPPAKAS